MIRDRNRLFIEHSFKEIFFISARLLMSMCLIALANLAVFGLFVLRGQISPIFVYFTLILLSLTVFCAIFISFDHEINKDTTNPIEHASQNVSLTKVAEHLLSQREVQAVQKIELSGRYDYAIDDRTKKRVESFLT